MWRKKSSVPMVFLLRLKAGYIHENLCDRTGIDVSLKEQSFETARSGKYFPARRNAHTQTTGSEYAVKHRPRTR